MLLERLTGRVVTKLSYLTLLFRRTGLYLKLSMHSVKSYSRPVGKVDTFMTMSYVLVRIEKVQLLNIAAVFVYSCLILYLQLWGCFCPNVSIKTQSLG